MINLYALFAALNLSCGRFRRFRLEIAPYVRDKHSFHLSAGLVHDGSKFDAKGKPNNGGGYTINGVNYRSVDVGTLDGSLVYRKAAPCIGIGWGNAVKAAPG